MLKILRQLTPEEMRQVEMDCGARPGSGPEEIIRCLSRLCGAMAWGLFPAAADDVLLDHAGQRLGMPPLIRGPRALGHRERAILAVYLRQAWQAADPDRQQLVLDLALEEWDNPVLPRPDRLSDGAEQDRYVTLEALLQQPAGCRALAVATARVPLPLPDPGPSWPRLPIAGRSTQAHQALYAVLLVLWRARARLLRERRTQRAQLERQLRQLQSLLEVRHRDLTGAPLEWTVNPASGASVAAAAGASAAVHLALGASLPVLLPAAALGAAGLLWSAAAVVFRPRARADRRLSRLGIQIQSFRSEYVRLEREIFELETD